MALRSLTRTARASSGPGRGPASDSRTQHRHAVRRRTRRKHLAAERTRLRAEALFAPPQRYTEPEPVPMQAVPARGPTPRTSGPFADPIPAGALAPDQEPVRSWRERVALAVRDRVPLWVQTRCGIERRGAVALVVVLGVVALFAVQHFWAGRTQQVQAPETVRAAAPQLMEPSNVPASPVAPGPAASGGAGIIVDVSGKVRRPGVQRLPAGARVADALRAAGGVRPGTDTAGLNRARLLTDGEQVLVGAPGVAPVPAAPGGGPAGAAPPGPVGLNTATPEQLDTLPGVGPVLAQHIIDYRTEHGGFRSVDELREVNGIGDRRFEDLQNLVRP
ncbi:helix-hairpin-helix domain-containing protein [Streptomyces sp. NPDC102467]|uniref:helix-hairpin-helix domain-containing protein n=1 Tax=Streptomyces sp. NPDC102467 TaxID=3366179 RepID=UPI00380EFECB